MIELQAKIVLAGMSNIVHKRDIARNSFFKFNLHWEAFQTKVPALWELTITWRTFLICELLNLFYSNFFLLQIFTGAKPLGPTIRDDFPEPILARFIRVVVVASTTPPCLRFEVYGGEDFLISSKKYVLLTF